MKSVIFFGIIFLFLSACTSVKSTGNQSSLSQADVERVKELYPNYTLAELNQGKTLFDEKCTICHGSKSPTSETPAKWKKIVPEMSVMANAKVEVINSVQENLILKYLITMSMPSK